jgi:hypothetical protein
VNIHNSISGIHSFIRIIDIHNSNGGYPQCDLQISRIRIFVNIHNSNSGYAYFELGVSTIRIVNIPISYCGYPPYELWISTKELRISTVRTVDIRHVVVYRALGALRCKCITNILNSHYGYPQCVLWISTFALSIFVMYINPMRIVDIRNSIVDIHNANCGYP